MSCWEMFGFDARMRKEATIKKMQESRAELEHLSEIIGLIYEGATDPARWSKDILPAMCDYIQAPGCLLFSPMHTPQAGGYAFTHGISQEFLDLYSSKYQHQDIWTIAAVLSFVSVTLTAGASRLQRGMALGQRGWKRQPAGGCPQPL